MRHRRSLLLTGLAVAGLCGTLLSGTATATPETTPTTSAPTAEITAFPSPGDGYASPTTRITFRGADPAVVADATVTGSESGVHTGSVTELATTDGAVFAPDKAFTPGETVTVSIDASVRSATDGSFSFRIARPSSAVGVAKTTTPQATAEPQAAPMPASAEGSASAAGCTVPMLAYKSRPDLKPNGACTNVNKMSQDAGYLLTASNAGPGKGETIYTSKGSVVWHRHDPGYANNLRRIVVGTTPRLVFFTGTPINEMTGGDGKYVVLNNHYQQVDTIKMQGFPTDFHELQITRSGTALVGSYNKVERMVDGRKLFVYDYVVQEVDFQHDNAVLFEWHSLDHVSVKQSHVPVPAAGEEFGYFHGNSIELTPDGNLLISSRNTWGIYKVSRTDGHTIWTLGMPANGAKDFGNTLQGSELGWFCYQHDARVLKNGNISLFDNGGAGPDCSHAARSLVINVDEETNTARVVKEYRHTPDLMAQFAGNSHVLSNGNHLVSWANTGVVTEFDKAGAAQLDMNLGRFSYRVYRSDWQGFPMRAPDAAVDAGKVYVSWNGATEVSQWQLLGGSSQDNLKPIGQPVPNLRFETAIAVPDNVAYVAVRALNASGAPMARGTSNAIATG